MPNWCENDLTLLGKTKDIEKFKEHVETSKSILDENTIVPYPDTFNKMDEEDDEYSSSGFNAGGYEWCVENWGTKWGICDPEIIDEWDYKDESEMVYSFRTAWSPPTPLIEKMSEMFPDIEFDLRFFEAGMAYNGVYRIKNGVIIENETAKYFGNRGG